MTCLRTSSRSYHSTIKWIILLQQHCAPILSPSRSIKACQPDYMLSYGHVRHLLCPWAMSVLSQLYPHLKAARSEWRELLCQPWSCLYPKDSDDYPLPVGSRRAYKKQYFEHIVDFQPHQHFSTFSQWHPSVLLTSTDLPELYTSP